MILERFDEDSPKKEKISKEPLKDIFITTVEVYHR